MATAPSVCSPPANPNTTGVTSVSVLFNWTILPGASCYEVAYRELGTTAWILVHSATNVSFMNVSPIASGKTFEWKVRTQCQLNPKVWSGWSPKLQFTSGPPMSFSLGTGTAINANSYLFNSGGFFLRQKNQVIFTQAEFLANGMTAGSVIDTLSIYIAQRNSTIPYEDFMMSYYYTTPGFSFVATPSAWAPVMASGGTLLGPLTLNLTTIPATGGWVHFPVNLVWNGSKNDLVLEMCWDNGATSATPSDVNYSTQTPGARKVASVRAWSTSVPGCSLLPDGAANTFRNANEYRPNIAFSFY